VDTGRNGGNMPWSGYATASPLRFRCGVFGFRTDRSFNATGVEAQVTLFRESDRKPLSETDTMPVPAATLRDHYLAGQLDITGLPPGDYIMQLIAWDRLAAPKKQRSAQSTRFVIPPSR
jgi:hypothetical protein